MNVFFCSEFVALLVDLSAGFASASLSSGLGEGIQRSEGRAFKKVAGRISAQLTEQIAGIGSVAGAFIVRLANHALHAYLILGLVRVYVTLMT